MSKKLSRAEIFSACDDIGRHKKDKKFIPKPTVKTNDGPVIRYTDKGNKVKLWTPHLEDSAWRQAQEFADLPFIHPKGLALMPDVHYGKDVPVGSVLPTMGALVPAAVGVDIGCGVVAAKLNIHANDLPSNLARLRRAIERRVPVSAGGRHKDIPEHVASAWTQLEHSQLWLKEKYPRAYRTNAVEQLGTLGSGNHFIEVCLDENNQVWIMLHSGSRGAGSMIGQFFIEQAMKRCRENGTSVGNLGWFMDEDPLFDPYVKAVEWAQNYAHHNRQCMLHDTLMAIRENVDRPVEIVNTAINCHHNYIARETHGQDDVWVTRKGAIRARQGDLGIIPSAMGQESFIVEGKGDTDSWCSCAHGAGRAMSRSAAKKRFTAKDLKAQTAGVECRKDKSVVDEIPSAYKPIQAVMKNQKDLVVIKHRLKAKICVKGV